MCFYYGLYKLFLKLMRQDLIRVMDLYLPLSSSLLRSVSSGLMEEETHRDDNKPFEESCERQTERLAVNATEFCPLRTDCAHRGCASWRIYPELNWGRDGYLVQFVS